MSAEEFDEWKAWHILKGEDQKTALEEAKANAKRTAPTTSVPPVAYMGKASRR